MEPCFPVLYCMDKQISLESCICRGVYNELKKNAGSLLESSQTWTDIPLEGCNQDGNM